MSFLIFVILFCFFVFLFVVYLLSRDDFVLIRKDITTERVFNVAFVLLAVSIFSSRLLYVVSNPSWDFLNPLTFLLFPYFPGLSLVGGVGGGVLFLLILSKLKKLPIGRIFDIFSISALCSFPFGILGYFLLSGEFIFSIRPIVLFFVHSAGIVFFLKIFLPRMLGGRFKDGTVGFLFLTFFSVLFFIDNVMGRGGDMLDMRIEDLVLILMLYTSVVFIIRQEKLISRVKRLNFKTITKLSKR